MRCYHNVIIFNMPYEILTDDGYSVGKVILLGLLNLAATIYLALYVLSWTEMIAISSVILVMFVIEVFTTLRVQKSLTNAIILLLISVGTLIGYQYYRSSSAG